MGLIDANHVQQELMATRQDSRLQLVLEDAQIKIKSSRTSNISACTLVWSLQNVSNTAPTKFHCVQHAVSLYLSSHSIMFYDRM